MMRTFFQLQLASFLCLGLAVGALRYHRAQRALGYVPPFLPGLHRVKDDPAIRYEELILDETRLHPNIPSTPPIFSWNDAADHEFSSNLISMTRNEGMKNPWLRYQKKRPEFQTRFGTRLFRSYN